jgi:pyruvate kinase
MTRRTKIVATIGPASDTATGLQDLIRAGVDVVRLNLSHGTIEEHLLRLSTVRAAAETVGKEVAVLADLPGPKIRSGRFPESGAVLAVGELVELRAGDEPSDSRCIYVQYETLLEDLAIGGNVMLGDGAISMSVQSVGDMCATVRVETGGTANGQPGVHLPSDNLRLATPTDEDLVLADEMATAGVEFIAVSFVRQAIDVQRVRDVVGTRAQLVAKIETNSSIANLDDIVKTSDAVMVARGDLGIDCPIEDVPHLQKKIIRHCVELGTPVITATQMLESMIESSAPTRAEVSDVANAVFDGTDAVMLSGETAIGRDPVSVVATMGKIAERAESAASYRQWADRLGRVQLDGRHEPMEQGDRVTAALTHAASQAAIDSKASAILCCTNSGRTARAMARFRPEAEMIALSPEASMVRSLALTWGVIPMQVGTYESTDEMVWFAVETALRAGAVRHGDTVVVLAGVPAQRQADLDRNLPKRSWVGRAASDVMRIVHVD